MATREFSPESKRGRSRRNRSKCRSATHAYGVPVPRALHEAIENERGNLSKAESVLGCLVVSMEHNGDSADCADRPYYPDVAQLARELVKQSINRLDSLVLQKRLARNKIEESSALSCGEGTYRDLRGTYSRHVHIGGCRGVGPEGAFRLGEELRLSLPIAFRPLAQGRSTATE